MTEHHHDHQAQGGQPDQGPAAFWDQRYGEKDQLWSGEPNHSLVQAVSGLTPGKALDLGCGEGGDSVWLARQGWAVTGVDVSATAVSRARARAAAHGVPEHAVNWVVQDLAHWEPAESYDLVSACFLHSPVELPRAGVLRRAAAAVAKGGHMLVVGHAEPPPWARDLQHADHHFDDPDQELAELGLDATAWQAVLAQLNERPGRSPDGEPATLRDSVLLLQRR
jgi:SAM-dependent methyltransferase